MNNNILNRESSLNNINNVKVTVAVPFRQGNDGFFYDINNTKDAIFNDIKAFLFTNKGERVMRSNFGIGFRKYAFEPNDDQLRSSLENEIKNGLKEYFSFVNLSSLKVYSKEQDNSLDENQVRIKMKLQIKFAQEVEEETIDKIIQLT